MSWWKVFRRVALPALAGDHPIWQVLADHGTGTTRRVVELLGRALLSGLKGDQRFVEAVRDLTMDVRSQADPGTAERAALTDLVDHLTEEFFSPRTAARRSDVEGDHP